MADKRINELTTKTYANISSGDYLAIDNGSETETNKLQASSIKNPIEYVTQKVSGSSDAYSSSKSYKAGDVVIYNNTLYECQSACSPASWSVNQSHFTAKTVATVLSELNSDLKFYTKTTASLAHGASESFNLPSGFDADKVIAIPYYRIADSWYRYAPASEEYAVDIDGRQSPVLVTVRNDHSGARVIKVNFIQIG